MTEGGSRATPSPPSRPAPAEERNPLAAPAGPRDERRLLVCYDGTDESERALARVVEIAAAAPTSVTVISVAESLYPMRPYTGYADPAEEAAHRRLLEDAAGALAAHGIAATTLVATGETAAEIVEAARETGADLIVVGSRRRGLVRRLLFGSASGELVVRAPFDVLVVR